MFKQIFSNSIIVCLLITGSINTVLAATQEHPGQINFSEIKEYAQLANVAYLTESGIRKYNFSHNYTLSHYQIIPELEVSYFLITNNISKTQIIAVRGTSNIENAIIDVALQLVLNKHTGIRLHNGFSQAAEAIYTNIKPLLKKDYIIHTTGHSLGGAVALILAMHLNIDNFNIGKIVTFGQPKVTNIAGAHKFKPLNIIRVVTEKDLVPLLPPFDPVDLNNLDIYWHAGQELVLLTDNTYALLEGTSSMLRATQFTQQPVDENNLQNHQITLYLSMLNKKIPTATLVPFKNSLNLFNLFGSKEK
ncbi:MAG: lipase family protein [Gammaproteobacteria bacterium]|nr:lipase family protein [Gammaproteobacteria bacterium]MDH5735774.1 lipase family protein [Gammaproteobacteria bacterium]